MSRTDPWFIALAVLVASATTPTGVSNAAGTPPAPAHVELLHRTDASVRVSSTVQNPANLPLHLVDGSLDTAWNSRTDDLVGAWIEVTVPPGATVDAVRLTAGYTFVGAHGDLFPANQRVRSIRI